MENAYEPFPLNDIQTAYLMGLNEEFEIGGFTTQYYTEIEGSYDMKKAGGCSAKGSGTSTCPQDGDKRLHGAADFRGPAAIYNRDHRYTGGKKNRKRALAEHRVKNEGVGIDRTRMPYFTIKAFKLGEHAYRICFFNRMPVRRRSGINDDAFGTDAVL